MRRTDEPLLERAQKGDVDAFAAVFEPLRATVHAVAYRLVGPDEADDVVMETYLKAWRALPRFRRNASLRTWLYRITHNCAMDVIRERQRRREAPLTPADADATRRADFPDPRQVTPDEALIRDETVRRVRTALAALPDVHHTALQLRYAEGLSYQEIAAATGVSIGTVMSRLFNAKRKLRGLLGSETDE